MRDGAADNADTVDEEDKEGKYPDNGVLGGINIIVVGEAHPHTKLVEGQGQADAVNEGLDAAAALIDDGDEANDGQHKETVDEVVNMRAMHVEEELGVAGDEESGGDEGGQEACQNPKWDLFAAMEDEFAKREFEGLKNHVL